MPRLLHEARKMSRLMGLSKPLPSRKVESMKNIPSKEKMEVTLSVMAIALICFGVASIAMMAEAPVSSTGALQLVNAGSPARAAERCW